MPILKSRRDDTLIRALLRAYQWPRRIESGQAKPITNLAGQEGVTDACVCRLLPPNGAEAILDGRQREGPKAG